MPQYKIEDLNKFYSEAESSDTDLFAEMRSNCLLVLGDHWNKKGSKFWSRIRDSKDLSNEQRIRLTKNHIQRITKTYCNAILSHAPGVAIRPKNESEVQDQKAASLFDSMWAHIKEQSGFKSKIRAACEDMVNIGEAHFKIFWSPQHGQLLGYEPEVDQSTGMPYLDQNGQIMQSQKPIWSGQIQFERVYAFNLLRDPNAKDFIDSEFLIYRKMVSLKELQEMVGNDPAKLKFIQESQDETFTVFDAANGQYKQVKDQTMLLEYYFRPSAKYPKGYYYYATKTGILFEGELPLGIFPIVSVGFDDIATSPRSRSIIKQLRPYQAEINRASSKIAETQVSSDDKLIIQDGTKISHGGTLPGVRAIKVSGGMAPTILPGRSGEQYIPYVEMQVKEMYDISGVSEEIEELPSQLDAYTLLFRSLRQKKKFTLYAEKFEQFLIDIAKVSLRLTKAYIQPNALIPAVGKKEYVNISEFKSADDLAYQIVVEPQTEDLESKMGRQLTMNHVLQFVGAQLPPDDIGKIIQSMPYVNEKEAFGDMTLDYENSKNDVLALDRGEYRHANKYDNHAYIIKRLINRMKQADFEQLSPLVKQLYQMKLQEHEQLEADNQRQKLAANADMIPSQGYLVGCDFYISDPLNAGKTRRARVPYDALAWLIQRLTDQGYIEQGMEGMPDAEVARLSGQRQAMTGSPQQPTPFQSTEEAQQAQAAMLKGSASAQGVLQ